MICSFKSLTTFLRPPLSAGKKILAMAGLLTAGFSHVADACSPLNVPTLISQSVAGNVLSLNWQSSTIYHCADAIDVEIACSTMAFSGSAAYTYTSATITGATTPYTYPTMTINIASLCPGTVYNFRARERNNPGSTASGWTPTYTFMTSGTFVPPTISISASPPIIALCPTGSSTLSVNCTNCCGVTPYNYTWTPAASLTCSTCATPVASPTVNTVYTVTVNGGQLGCWVATNTVLVQVTSAPPSIGTAAIAPATMCAGNPATVSISSYSGSIQWLSAPTSAGPFTNVTGATSGSFVTGPLSSGMCYYAKVSGCGPALSSNTVCVTVNPSPTITVNSTSICAGSVANLTANGATSYVWSTGANPTGVNTATASPAATTSYTVTGTTAGCTGTAVANVTVMPMPVPTATNNGPVCTGGVINLGAGGGGTYSWSGPNSFSSTLQNPSITPATIPNGGVYTVSVSLAGCVATATTNLVITTPTASATNTGPYCAGATIHLAASSGTGYTWKGPGGYTSSVQTPTIANSTSAMSGIYSLTVNLGTCFATASTSVTVYALPSPSISSNSPVCINMPINFTGSGGVSYAWLGPNFVSNAQNPTIPNSTMGNNGTVTLTVIDANNCTNTVTSVVVVNPQPVVAAFGATVCQNSAVNLVANGGTSYSWTGPGGFTSNVQNPSIPNAQVSASGQYNVIVTDANTCTNTAVANVEVDPQPVANIQTNSPICINNVLMLSGLGGVSYAWTGPNGFFSTAQSPTINANSVAYTGNYSLTVTDAKGCTATIAQQATVNPLPSVSLTSDVTKGCPPLCVNYTCQASPSIATYNWTMGDGSTGINPVESACYNKAGTYTVNVTVTDVNGCTNATSYTVAAYPYPVADFNYDPIKPVENIDEVHFTDATYSASVTAWSWFFNSTAQYTSSEQNPNFTYTDAGEYAVALVVKSDHGCTDTVVKNVLVGEDFGIYLPNAFTPNGDGLNDTFHAKGFGVSKFEMQVFDRWGEKIFDATDMKDAWDGTYTVKGTKTISEGVYTWRAKVTSVYGKTKELTGHVTLIK